MKFLRTIFIHHIHKRHHFLNPKCVFSSLASSSPPEDTETLHSTNPRNESTNSWSIYGNVVVNPRINDHSDEKIEEEKPSESENGSMMNLKNRSVIRPVTPPTKRSTGKVKTQWVCSSCGYTAGQWWGTCPSCTMVGTMKEFHEAKINDVDNNKVRSGISVSEDAMGAWLPQRGDHLRPVKLSEVNRGFNEKGWRFPLSGPFGDEVSIVLGGGLVPGSLNLFSGDPGVGKSTLLLQMAALVADGCNGNDGEALPVVYVSGEESLQQIAHRADRLGIKSDIYLYSSTDIEDILRIAQSLPIRALVVDSIQTVYLKGITGSAGGVTQVKECTSALMRFAKTTNIPVLLIGHVTKSGDIAGPRVLEHIVDVVLYLEGERFTSYRMLRAVKNRFGSTDELGVFEMSESGFKAVSNATEMFLTEQDPDSDVLVGLAFTVIMDGSRTFIIEVQALCLSESTGSRVTNGIEANRANMIKCVLIKQAGLNIPVNSVHLNVVSGLTLSETAGDLAIAAAICSSFLEYPIPKGIAFIGEIGLSGELRTVPRIDKRVHALSKLGYKTCVVPKQAVKALGTEGLENIEIVGCKNLKEFINVVFSR
ncbi:DNA repair protein RadA-like [Trifolium pratense]|uniref:DNA repair protein RadA-like n=1 Tax=Trifolium pratense TaxID=57577 RepID=UPI001E693054|nr:DNA repair protein RadA-like [Trifolium pratense]